ncbi:MAG TPA: ATP synthase F1 subunit epsilon [Gammaproteobacteria bacterium]|nr:ATP synthase F1 subunit epsilon [Gammaproteobacteria bacterium]
MALRFHVDIVSAEARLFDGQADQLFVPTQLGELGILARHAPLIGFLKPGLVRVMLEDQQLEAVFVNSGFVEVQASAVTILADTALRSEDLDKAAAEAARRIDSQGGFQAGRLDSEMALNIALVRALEEVRRAGRKERSWPTEPPDKE